MYGVPAAAAAAASSRATTPRPQRSCWLQGDDLYVSCSGQPIAPDSSCSAPHLRWLASEAALRRLLWRQQARVCEGGGGEGGGGDQRAPGVVGELQRRRHVLIGHGHGDRHGEGGLGHGRLEETGRGRGLEGGRGSCPLTGPLPFDLIYTDYHGLQQMKQHMGLSLKKHNAAGS
ncbi:hypothetical protein CRUP_024032 [Coryphaenoides rupestris]|nr:hypothetical protein CRUP_024032 [Coryphaenoides rupestris]